MKKSVAKMEQETSEINISAEDIQKEEEEFSNTDDLESRPLFEIAKEKCSLFRNPEFETFGLIDMEGHLENWAIKSKHFSFWLSLLYYKNAGEIPKATTIRETVRQFEGEAYLNSPVEMVHIRYAWFSNEIYIDLANDRWEQIRITKDGCSIISSSESPVRFIRAPGMLALPHPVFGESLTPLWDFLNINHPGDRVLIVSWLIGAMRPGGPFPILILQGEQGTAKSTTARILCSLIDPSIITSRSLPRSERDLAISANKSWVLNFDNLSGLSPWLSDAFCRVSTGGGLATRTLFTDDSEKLFRLKRPLILNGISDIATRHDLADRALIVSLPPIPEDKRRSEREILRSWSHASGGVLGALCDAVSTALRNIGGVKLEKVPRMADFAEWVTAAEPALPWEKGTCLKEYISNRECLVDIALEADPVGAAVMELMGKSGEWSGTPTDLLNALNKIVPKVLQRRNTWPKRPNTLSNRLNQVAPALRKKGIEFERSRSGQRRITITKTAKRTDEIVHPVQLADIDRHSAGREQHDDSGIQDHSQVYGDNTSNSHHLGDADGLDDLSQDQSNKTLIAGVDSSVGDREQGEI